ncbi:APC family permease [Asanoa iriomotensis]|uniref:Amino acid permease n=1 Tax=Asanoa iriomotensis TaxID=234613 RepID=A0ABQ4BZE0_9ACTN|nr:amino acid permease [Asanoa iriomotensis]GIF55875.1 amino acid permease [Asanoa iriomotensis]
MTSDIGTARGSALYIGALLGPGLLLLPGLAAHQAGPASVVAWAVLLGASALFAVVFAALGVRHPSAGGVWGYATAGLGPRAGRAVGWCFLAGVIAGAPIVCVIGGNYVAELTGGGVRVAVITAALLLVGTLTVIALGVRASASVQFGLVALLLVIVVGAVVGAAPAAEADNWTPFAPHGWSAIGRAAATLMLAFVGWEAIAPLTTRIAKPHRVIAIAFTATAVIYLALGIVTVAALGDRAGTEVPLAALLTIGLGGTAGTAVAAVGAVVLTVGAVLAYVSGAASLARALRPKGGSCRSTRPATGPAAAWRRLGIIRIQHRYPGNPEPLPDNAWTPSRLTLIGRTRPLPVRTDTLPPWLAGAVLVSGLVLIGPLATGRIDLTTLVNVPTTFFLVVYLGCTAAGWRLLRGGPRICAAVACGMVAVVLAFCGFALVPAALVTLAAVIRWPRLLPLRAEASLRER